MKAVLDLILKRHQTNLMRMEIGQSLPENEGLQTLIQKYKQANFCHIDVQNYSLSDGALSALRKVIYKLHARGIGDALTVEVHLTLFEVAWQRTKENFSAMVSNELHLPPSGTQSYSLRDGALSVLRKAIYKLNARAIGDVLNAEVHLTLFEVA